MLLSVWCFLSNGHVCAKAKILQEQYDNDNMLREGQTILGK